MVFDAVRRSFSTTVGVEVMAFDGLVMAAVKHELNEVLLGGRVEKIYQPLALEIALIIHKDRHKYRLLISADPRDARIHITSTAKENPLTPPLFCMVLRKHLEGGKITGIDQTGLERVLHIRIEGIDELGILSEKTLVCEVMGKHSNIVLVDPSTNVILDGINRYSYATSRHREILPGRQYISPPATGKLNPLEVTEDEFRTAVWDTESDIPVDKIILSRFEGFSPQTCREIAVRAGVTPGLSIQYIGELELQRLWEAFLNIRNSVISGAFTPVICFSGKKPAAFSAVALSQQGENICRQCSMNVVLDEFFSTKEAQERLDRAASELMKTVKEEIRKSKKKTDIHQDTVRKAEDAEKLKISGELITANIYQIPKGAESAEVVNYYDPEQKTVDISLNPRLSPAENAQQYYKRYTKARHGKEIAETYINELKEELSYLESVSVAIEQAESLNELAEIRSELTKEGYIKPQKEVRGSKKQTPPDEPVPLVIEIKGFKILVGRNNRQNDYATMKLAASEDLWFHVKDIPGSHVAVKNPEGNVIPNDIIQQAAEIAAFYSKARNSSKVPVDYTLRKHVRKPKKAKPGMVIYDNQKTVMVEPKIPV